jgi:hypothetical protein
MALRRAIDAARKGDAETLRALLREEEGASLSAQDWRGR